MKNRKILSLIASVSIAVSFASGIMFVRNTPKAYEYGDFIPELKAHYGGEITSPGGYIKAKKSVVPTDDKYNSQKTHSLGKALIGDIESVWSDYTGKGTKIAIIDDGFDVDHPEFTRSNGDSAILPESAYFFISGSSWDYQVYSEDPTCILEDWEPVYKTSNQIDHYEWATHGTNTATTAAAPMGNGGGVGIAPEADILAIKTDFRLASIDGAIRYAVDQGADVINMSLGAYAESFTDGWGDQQTGYSSTKTELESACQYAYQHNVIVVAAAGNESTYHKSYPACNYKVIGVGATGDWDNKGNANKLAEFTNYVGSNQTGEVNVDILAPGYVYTATQNVRYESDMQSSTAPSSHKHTYEDTQGTSFSCPIVAGTACLWREKYPDGTPDQFLAQLQATADGIGYYADKMIEVSGWYDDLTDVGPSNITNGRVNVNHLLKDDPYVTVEKNSFDISVGEKRQINITTSNGNITYSSSNGSVASVSETGLIEGKSAGNTTIRVTASKNSHTDYVDISVKVSAAVASESLSFSPTSVSMTIGDTYDAEATITTIPSNASRLFMFESSDEDVATVDFDTGLVTAVGEGTATITALAGYGDGMDELTVTVSESSTWTKVTSDSDITDGDYLIVCESVDAAFDGSLSTLDAGSNYIDVTISEDTIANSDTISASKFAIASMSGGYSIKSASGRYIYGTSGSNVLNDSSSAEANSITIDSNGNADIVSNTSHLRFNTQSGQNRFRYFKSSSYSSQTAIQLYKAGGSGSVTPTPPTPTPKSLSSITISGYETSLEVNSSFIFGGTVTAYYSDDTNEDVTSSATFSGYDMSAEGEYTVTVSYTYLTVTKTATYTLTVTSSGGSGGGSEGSYTIGWGEATGTVGTYSNFSATSGSVTDLLSFSTNQNSSNNAPFYSSSASELRLYYASSGDGGDITITPASEITLTGFVMTTSEACNVKYSVDGGSATSVSNSNKTYTVTGISATESLMIKNVHTSSQQLKIKTIALTYEVPDYSDKIVQSLTATYSGGDVYIGGSLNENAVSVTAKYTNSSKYPNEVLTSLDYSLSGFSSASSGNKTVTVTYNGKFETLTTPMTTTFTVTVIDNPITDVTVACSKTFHPGDTISKSDLTVTLHYQSGASASTNEYSFNSYQFTYDDASSGGGNTNKQLSITFNNQAYSFNAVVNRVAYQPVSGSSKTISSSDFNSSTVSKSSGTASSSSVTIAGIGFTVTTNAYIFKSGSTYYLSFNKGAGSIVNRNAFGADLTSVTVVQKSGSRQDGVLTISKDGTNFVSYSESEIAKGGYRYFKYAYTTSSSSYSNIQSISYTLAGTDNVNNVCNYIMYEDTNNQCVTKLDIAINKLNNMSNSDKSTFWTSNEYVIRTARERLSAWAIHEGKTLSFANNTFTANSVKYNPIIDNDSTNNIVLVVTVLSAIVATSICGYLLLKRKRI